MKQFRNMIFLLKLDPEAYSETCVNHQTEIFYENKFRLLIINYFRKNQSVRCFTEFWIHLWDFFREFLRSGVAFGFLNKSFLFKVVRIVAVPRITSVYLKEKDTILQAWCFCIGVLENICRFIAHLFPFTYENGKGALHFL